METRNTSSKVNMVYVSFKVSGTTRLVSIVVGHYWIGFWEGRIGFGLVSRGRGHYWIGYTLSETQLLFCFANSQSFKNANPFQLF